MNLLRAATIVLLPTLTLGAVLMTGTAEPLNAAASNMPTAKAAGIMVNYPIGGQEHGMPLLAFQGTLAKTKLAIIVDNPDGGIIALDRDGSTVQSFHDDKGLSLLEANNPFSPFAFGDRVVHGGKRLAVELESKIAPTKGAATVTAQGTLAVQTAHEKRTYTSGEAELMKGASLTAGPITMTVKGTSKSDWSEEFQLEVSTGNNLDALIQVTGLTPSGKRIPLNQRSTISFGDTTDLTFASKSDFGDTLALELEVWHEPRTRKVPFKIQASVGMN